MWAGPVANWIAACERILELAPTVVVPGHGPLATPAAVADLKGYFEFLTAEATDPLRRRDVADGGGAGHRPGPRTRAGASPSAWWPTSTPSTGNSGARRPTDALTLMGEMAALAG